MPFYTDHIYPHLVHTLGDPEPIRAVRRRIIPLAAGEVLEIGIGSGANFAHYDPAKISRLYALEPNPGMIRLAERQRHSSALDVAFLALPGERIPLSDKTIDTVVSTFTLCTIPGIDQAIHEICRVLRPEGRLIFLELNRSPDPSVRRWQQWWEPIQHRLYAGLYLTRDIPALLLAGGFQIERLGSAYLTSFPRSWVYACWGAARPE
jgi:ubiquinone/menaquinone biosynthesis C-methylase UbiE